MLLEQKIWIVKERVAFAKLTDIYDIFLAGGQQIGIAKEEPPEWAKWLRLLINKQLMPTVINVYENESAPPVFSIRRGVHFWAAKVEISAGGRPIGYFQSKMFSLGGAFRIFDAQNVEVGLVKGDWKGWNFSITATSGGSLGTVTKKWAGLGKELFTSADTYAIDISPTATKNRDVPALLLAAGLAIDIVYKERK